MSIPKTTGLRRFLIFTTPHAGDPLWLNPCVELDDSTNPATPIHYEDMAVLEQVILKIARDRARSQGFDAGAKEVLQTFGLTRDEYYKRKKENVAKKPIDNKNPKE